MQTWPYYRIGYGVCNESTSQPHTEAIFEILSQLGKAVKRKRGGFRSFTSVFGSVRLYPGIHPDLQEKMREFELPGNVLDELLLELTQGTTQYFAENQLTTASKSLSGTLPAREARPAGLESFRQPRSGAFRGTWTGMPPDAGRKR
jgi:pyrroline-5-carboxylate reductase